MINQSIKPEKILKPIFIGGTGRSGTTILKRVLSQHSMVVALPDELRVIVDPNGALELISLLTERWSPYNADIAIHRFLDMLEKCGRARTNTTIIAEKVEKNIFRSLGIAPRQYLGMGFRYYFGDKQYQRCINKLKEELIFHVTSGNWAGSPTPQLSSKIYESAPPSKRELKEIISRFFNNLYSNLTIDGQTHWLDDTPSNLLHTHELLSLFTEMRMIHIYRDPRDVLASYQGFSWGGDDYEIVAWRLAHMHERWAQIRRLIPADRYLEIGLEEISHNPRDKLQSICEFLDLKFDEKLMDIQLDQVNAGRWKRDIPPKALEKSEKYLIPYIKAYGYSLG